MGTRLALCFALLAGAVCAGDKPAEDKDSGNAKSSRPRVRLGGIMIGAGYSHFSGRPFGYYPYYSYGFGPYGYLYDPFLYGMYHPGYFSGFGYGAGMGQVKLNSADPTAAWVYIDGALAGRADKLKNMYLDAGVYDLEIRSGDKRFGQKVYVLTGKTLRLTADLARLEVRP